MFLIRFIKNVLRCFHASPKTDPLYACELYKDKGCVHIDGFLCNIKTCEELKEYRNLKKKDNEKN